MRILLCADIRRGGVSGFYDAVRSRLSGDVDFLPIGSREDQSGLARTLKRFLADNLAFYRLLRHNSYDIVHLNPSLDPKAVIRDGILLWIATRHKVRAVVFFHGWTKSFESTLSKYFLWPFKSLFSRASIILVLCSDFKNALLEMGFPNSIRVVTTAVDDEVFSPSLDETLSSKYANLREGSEILFLGRIERPKGIYEALEAFRIVKRRVPEIRLTVAGDGKELNDAKGYVSTNAIPGVTFTGHVAGKVKFDAFLRADIFLFPTYGEGLPVALLEAMAFGLPVVSRPVGGIKDFFEQGKMGFLAQSLNPEEFANLLENLLNNPALRHEISVFNRQYAKLHFSASKVARDFSLIYDEVLDKKRN